MFAEAIEDILRDQCTPSRIRAIEAGGSAQPLWRAFADAGFLELLSPESAGGAELPLPELFPLLTLLGRYAVPVPIAQSIAARALVGAGVQLPLQSLTLAPALSRNEAGHPRCPLVPFGQQAAYVLAADGETLLLLDADAAARIETDIAGSQLATLAWGAPNHAQALAGDAKALPVMAAAVHAALMAGAMAKVFDMTLQYSNDRQQFGRPLGKFQAIQHQLSVMAEHVAAVSIAAEAAFETDARTPVPLRAAMAKARSSEAAAFIADTAHALHGAIGVTEEYDLQLYTRRLREWRWAHGAEPYWNRIIGEAVLASGSSVAEFVRAV